MANGRLQALFPEGITEKDPSLLDRKIESCVHIDLDVVAARDQLRQNEETKPVVNHPTINELDVSKLNELSQLFFKRWNGVDKGLTKEEFIEAMKKTVKYYY